MGWPRTSLVFLSRAIAASASCRVDLGGGESEYSPRLDLVPVRRAYGGPHLLFSVVLPFPTSPESVTLSRTVSICLGRGGVSCHHSQACKAALACNVQVPYLIHPAAAKICWIQTPVSRNPSKCLSEKAQNPICYSSP